MQLIDDVLREVADTYNSRVEYYDECVERLSAARSNLDEERLGSKKAIEESKDLLDSISRKPVEVDVTLRQVDAAIGEFKPTKVSYEELYAKTKKFKLAFSGLFVGALMIGALALWETAKGESKDRKVPLLARLIILIILALLCFVPFKMAAKKLGEKTAAVSNAIERVESLLTACNHRVHELSSVRSSLALSFSLLEPSRGIDYHDLSDEDKTEMRNLYGSMLHMSELLNKPLAKEG